MKKVLILATSYRKNGNSAALAREFARGATESGNEVEIVYLADCDIAFCRGCFACKYTGKCVIDDDARLVAEKMRLCDVLVFATPVYYYCVSGQLKTMIDRANPLYGGDYKFTDVYLLAAAAEDEPYTAEGARVAVQGFVDCYERSRLAGDVFAGGVDAVGDIQGHAALAKAYATGKSVG